MYIPKNKIKTNLYTRGEEYQNIVTGVPYTGYYWTMYTGKIFTGKNPDSKPQEELIQISATTDNIWDLTSQEQTFQQYTYNYDAEVVPGQYQNMEDIDVYNNIRNVDISITKLVPQQYYPTPTDEEYKLGVFLRYFIVKTNENIYTEIDKTTYLKLYREDTQYLYELYTIFRLQWTLVGGEEEVSNANLNVIELREEKLQRTGLKEFLQVPTNFRYDYLQFYAPNSGEILYTGDPSKEGEEGLILPDGTTYIGYYHVMLNGTLMTGQSHNSGNNIILTRLYD
jgi:hypothetical protein|tara:strand:+ start:2735 stop:3580 length:846 start_codon:yes stop_codon:yes gene_type:complete